MLIKNDLKTYYYLLLQGLYEDNFTPLQYKLSIDEFYEVDNLRNACFMKDLPSAMKYLQIATGEFGTNWYDSAITIVGLTGELQKQLSDDDFVLIDGKTDLYKLKEIL